MGKNDPRVDKYIASASEFARPVLAHVREIIHRADPEVEETLKWSCPHFTHDGIVCGLAAFKAHCALILWKGSLIVDEKTKAQLRHITRLSDLPSNERLLRYIREAVRLNQEGVKVPKENRSRKKKLIVPEYLQEALGKNKKALTAFENLSYSHKKEYVEWLTEAKREETRQKRLRTTIEWLAEGKPRHWKYQNC